ncbi:MAG: homoserine dehydrogenase [Acidimicrobiales bacterium]
MTNSAASNRDEQESDPAKPADDARRVTVGILGCGVVGSALVELINTRREAIAATAGVSLVVHSVAVRSASKDRPGVPSDLLTTDAKALVADPAVDVVVEVIGGIEPARTLIRTAIDGGKPVVTANKELLANYGVELSAAADVAGVDLLFEAAAAGAIPIVRPLRESLLGEDITRVMGIVNGTTNFILSKMSSEGASYEAVLAEAQRLGYAEADPTADVGGFDAGAKAAIMASLAFGARVVAGDVYHEGIADITAADIDDAKALGYEIKLLAIAEAIDGDDGREIAVRVHPAMVPAEHPLASVRDSFNAVFVEGRAAGELMFYGRGAGGHPTASAVLGDLIDAAVNVVAGTHRPVPAGGSEVRIRPIDDISSAYYLNVEVNDSPGVLSAVAGVFGKHGLSISSMNQEGLGEGARIAFVTHQAIERDLQAALHDLRALDVVRGIGSVLRVIDA